MSGSDSETAEWRTAAIDPVMRLLYQSGVAVSPGGIVANLEHRMDEPPTRDEVLDALASLQERDHVRTLREVESYYLVTESGRDFVETEIDDEAFGFH